MCSQARLERAIKYTQKAAKIFNPGGPVLSVPPSTSDLAWEVMQKLESVADNCCSAAAQSVHRNKVGLKKHPFKPLR